ncbi:hypothetical protein Pla175_27040 [Pirellulimonas nuda]|uniref:Sialate O-acetylesterase domain-containing protein n=1 Tax=Pirellulimonas nuda TaxID=2528009 RepID=A0A518DCV8_9BACT|nr:sialate O-acetylesterase [Pirellulimonas nuda]QDU89315.1 hypothetical protein Pla175_27040 [Pirellulimonas nuda]
MLAWGVCAGGAVAAQWDLYLLGGQSNAVGWNTHQSALPAPLQAPQTDVLFFNGVDGSWGPLAPGSGNNANAFGPEITFGRTLADDNPGRQIAIVKHAVGATDLIQEWNPDDPGANEYDRLLDTLHSAVTALPAADTFSVKGMLWMQGEKDTSSAPTAAAYHTNLTNFISTVRTDLGVPDMPFVIGQLAFAVTSRTDHWPVVQNAQSRTAALDERASLVITTDLPLQGDNLHLTSAAQQTLGVRMADAIQGRLDPLQITNPSFETPARSDDAVNPAIVSGWIKSGGVIGTFNPGGGAYLDASALDANGGVVGAMEGTHALSMTGADASVEQTLSAAVRAGTTYKLTVAIGDRDAGGSPGFAGARIELLAGGQVLTDSGAITGLADGTFTDVSISYTAGAGDAGALGVRLVALDGAGGTSVDFDNVRLEGVSAVLAGDFNGDGAVDAADYTRWRDNLGAPSEEALHGAGSGGGGVDAADYTLWKSRFGTSGPAAPARGAGVPEPAAWLLGLLGAACSVRVARTRWTSAPHG